jgi:hypothetical protein
VVFCFFVDWWRQWPPQRSGDVSAQPTHDRRVVACS